MPSTMRAAVVREFGGPLTIEEVLIPEPGPNEVLVKVETCGVCHSDVHAVYGDLPGKPTLPLIPGHEAVGTIAKVGPGVTNVQEGARVGVPWINRTCATCELCLTGWENFCKNQQATGYHRNGGFAEYVLAGATYVAPWPDGLDVAEGAPILCAGLTVYKGIKESGARPGDWLAVSGVGGLGHLAVEYGKAMGMHVAAIDVSDEKLDLAKKLGADLVVNAADKESGKTIRKVTGGCHGVLVCAVANAAYQQSLGFVRTRGTLIMLSLPEGNLEVPIALSIGRGITVRGSAVGNRKDLQEALAFAAEGKVRAQVEAKPLDAANDIIEGLRAGKITGRVVLNIGN